MPDYSEQLNHILFLLDDAKATDIVTIDVKKQTAITDYMIIATGNSSRHVKAIATNLMERMKAFGKPAFSESGVDTGEWALIDFGDFIVHVMQRDTRTFFNLEGLWQES